MISAIDAHVHVWTDDRKRYPRLPGERDYAPARFTPEDLFVHTRPAGVARVVLIQMSFYRYDNSYMLDCIRQWPRVFSGVGIVDDSGPTRARRWKGSHDKACAAFASCPVRSARTWLDTPGMHTMWATGAKKKLSHVPVDRSRCACVHRSHVCEISRYSGRHRSHGAHRRRRRDSRLRRQNCSARLHNTRT